MSNPLEDYLTEKTANPGILASLGGTLKQEFPKAMLQGLGGAAGTVGLAAMGVGAKAIYDAATKSRDFRQMMEANPDLQEDHQRDPKFFNLAFSSLRRMQPSFTKDPLVAGTYMRRMVGSPGSAGGVAVEALQSGKGMASPIMDAFKPKVEMKLDPEGWADRQMKAQEEMARKADPRFQEEQRLLEDERERRITEGQMASGREHRPHPFRMPREK